MGTEYYIVDKQNKTYYQLGKGGWYGLHDCLFAVADPEILSIYILDEAYHNVIYSRQEWCEIREYIKSDLAPELFKLFGTTPHQYLKIINDCSDDLTILKVKKYKCIGTRYRYDNENMDDYLKHMNRHLEDNPYNRRCYNPPDYYKYPEWEEY